MNALLFILALSAPPGIEVHRTGTWQEIYVQPEEERFEEKTEAYTKTGCWCEMCQRLGWSGYKTTGRILINAATPFEEIEAIMRIVGMRASDRVCDAGSGDGRVVILAAKEFGSRGVGLDTRQEAIELGEANARRSAVTERTEFKPLDALEVAYDRVSVVYAHLPPNVTKQLGGIVGHYSGNVRLAISYAHKWGQPGEKQVGKFWVWKPGAKVGKGSPDPDSIAYDYRAPQADQNTVTKRPAKSPPPSNIVVRAWGASWCTGCKSAEWQKTLDALDAVPYVTVRRMDWDENRDYCYGKGITTLPALQIMNADESEQVALKTGPMDFTTAKAIVDGRAPPERQSAYRNTSPPRRRGGS